MRIAGLIYESLTKTGGYEIFTYNLMRAFAAKGHEVSLYLPPREIRRHPDFYATMPFAVRCLAPRTRSLFKRAPWLLHAHLRLEQARHGYDAWQVMGGWWEADTARGLAGRVPLVLRVYGEDVLVDENHDAGVRRDPAVDKRVRRAVSRMDRCVAMTPALAVPLREMGVQESHIVSIPNGIDFSRLSAPRFRERREDVRSGLGIADDRFLILTVGRHHPRKGFDLIPDIAARLKERDASFHWIVVGRDVPLLQPELERAGVADQFHLLPALGVGDADTSSTAKPSGVPPEIPTDPLVELFAASDALCFPSRLEGYPRVVLEAQAAGLPAVVTNGPGCDVVADDEEGYVVNVDDTEAMAERLARIMHSPDTAARFADAARTRAAACDWSRIADRYLAIYRELSGRS